jgi:hypothetical protein
MSNWLPLLVVLTYVLAPIPNRVAMSFAHSNDYFNDEPSKGVMEIGYFMTSCFIVSGFGLPFVLNHASIITDHAMYLSLVGGGLIYITILGYMYFFTERVDDGF